MYIGRTEHRVLMQKVDPSGVSVSPLTRVPAKRKGLQESRVWAVRGVTLLTAVSFFQGQDVRKAGGTDLLLHPMALSA